MIVRGTRGRRGRLTDLGRGTPAGKTGGFLEVTRLRRSTSARGAVHEGTSGMQRESLMLSRLKPDWKVILVNHFPSLMDSSSYASTSSPCALYFQKAPCLPGRCPSPQISQAAFIRYVRIAQLLGDFLGSGGLEWR